MLVIIGTIVGAGFASGKEIEIFFLDYGYNGILGILLTSFLVAIIVNKIMKIVEFKNINSYEDFINEICFIKNQNGKIINGVIKAIINVFLLVSFFAMISGFANFFKQEFNIPIIVCSMVFIFICYITLLNDIKGIVKTNSLLIPFLIISIILISIKNIPSINLNALTVKKTNWVFSAVLYASYNSLVIIPILVEMKKIYKGKKLKNKLSIYLLISFAIIMLSLFTILINKGNLQSIQIPMIYIMNGVGTIYKNIYGVVLVISIYSSAIAAGYGFLKNVTKTEYEYKKFLKIISIFGITFSYISFSYFIEIMYPFFGFLGLLQIFLIFKNKCSKI